MHIATISSEMVPFAKTGGLADVCGALPAALEQIGCKCSCFLPAYRQVMRSGMRIESTDITFTVYLAGNHVACRLLKSHYPGSNVDVYLIDQPRYFDRDGLYAGPQGEYKDNCERFSFFCRSVVEAIDRLNLDIDIVHCHDWQAGLVPAYVRTRFGHYPWMQRAKTIMTIHNLAYQGRFWHLDMPLTGLDWRYFNHQQMEFHGDLNLMKTGIVFADNVSTVSPTYAKEITEPGLGCGLEDILKGRGEHLVGIVNGVDYQKWDPQIDSHLSQCYSAADWETGKAACKKALQAELGMTLAPDAPLIGIVSRLADQKGWDLIIPVLERWVANRDVQWAVLGTGDPRYEEQLQALASQRPDKLGARFEFSEALAHQIEAGSDMFLMPSRYEPCGLNQLYSLKYGCVPLVHTTGGLADTVLDSSEGNVSKSVANGFHFNDYSQDGLESVLNRAIDTYSFNRDRWRQIVINGMQADWSWKHSASEYMKLFRYTMDGQLRGA